MDLKFASVLHVLVMLMLLAATATAGPLPTDTNAFLRGTSLASGSTGANGKFFNGEIQYAVYAPGTFSTSATLNFPYNAPTNPTLASFNTDYVYAYEILNNGLGSTATVTNFSLQLDPLHVTVPNLSTRVGYDIGQDTAPGPKAPDNYPNFKFFKDPYKYANINWRFSTTAIAFTQHSEILLFTTPFAPTFKSSTLTASAKGFPVYLPSPIPEPATAALAGIAAICLLAAKWARRRPA